MKRILFVAALSFLAIPGASGEDKKTRHEFQVRAVSYRAFSHENLSTATFPACYGAGADSSFWATMHLNCQTMTTPPPVVAPATAPTNTPFIEVYNLVEANGSIYAITCKARWVGNECTWFMPEATFQAEVQGWTMWVTAPRSGDHSKRSGNHAKEIRRKFRLLDVLRQQESPVPDHAVGLPGSYWGVLRSAPAGVSVRFGVAIRAENGSLNGCMAIQAPLLGSGAIRGTIKGNEISFDAVGSDYVLKFRGESQGPEVKGTYAVAPDEDDGAFILRKSTPDASPAGFNLKDCLKTLISLDPPGPSL